MCSPLCLLRIGRLYLSVTRQLLALRGGTKITWLSVYALLQMSGTSEEKFIGLHFQSVRNRKSGLKKNNLAVFLVSCRMALAV